MTRPPIFTKGFFKRAAAALKEAGTDVVVDFLGEEPILKEYLEEVVKNSAARVFKGVDMNEPLVIFLRDRIEEQLRMTAVKVLMTSRECYRDLSVRQLEKQLELDFEGTAGQEKEV